MKKIVVINYGMGNLRSVINALGMLGYTAEASHQRTDFETADALILPGVGAFGEAMHNLRTLGIVECLKEQVCDRRKPFLGICLGMQLIAQSSDEMGSHTGLGWIDGKVLRIDPGKDLRLPHVGWNEIQVKHKDPLFHRIDTGAAFLFDHSYHLVCPESIVSSRCEYGRDIAASIQRDNIFATQFHPEKSQIAGLKLLRNFCNHVEKRN